MQGKINFRFFLRASLRSLMINIVAWWLAYRTSMPEVMGSNPALVRRTVPLSRQGMNPQLLPDCTESGSIGAQNVQHMEILC